MNRLSDTMACFFCENCGYETCENGVKSCPICGFSIEDMKRPNKKPEDRRPNRM